MRPPSAIRINDRPDGQFRRILLEWTDEAGARQSTILGGLTAVRVHHDLERQSAISEDARFGYLVGLVRGMER